MLLFSHSVVFDSLWPQGLQRAKLPCPLLSPGVCLNSSPLSQWCHPNISSSAFPFFALQSFPASGSFPVSWLFTSGGQNIGASASASVLPMNIQDWFPLGLTGLTPCCPRDSQEFSTAPHSKASAVQCSVFLIVQFNSPTLTSVHDYQKNHSFDCMDLYQQSNVYFLICCLDL